MAKSPPANLSDQIDQDLARAAIEARRRGEKAPPGSLAALRRVEKAREEQLRFAYYESIPRSHWEQLSGRQRKILNEQSARYGIPLGGKTLSLSKIAQWVHQFLSDHGRKLLEILGDQIVTESPAMERWREEKAEMARMERETMERAVLPRREVHESLVRTAGIMRKAGELLNKNHGPEAARILEEALEDCQREYDALWAGSDSQA